MGKNLIFREGQTKYILVFICLLLASLCLLLLVRFNIVNNPLAISEADPCEPYGLVYAIDLESGDVVWESKFDEHVSNLTLTKDRLEMVDSQGKKYVADIEDVSHRPKFILEDGVGKRFPGIDPKNPNARFSYRSEDGLDISMHGTEVLAKRGDSLIWKYELGEYNNASEPYVYKGVFYFGTSAGSSSFYALDIIDGSEKWIYVTGSKSQNPLAAFRSKPQIYNDRYVVTAGGDSLYIFDMLTGYLRTKTDLVGDVHAVPIIIRDSTAIVGTSPGGSCVQFFDASQK